MKEYNYQTDTVIILGHNQNCTQLLKDLAMKKISVYFANSISTDSAEIINDIFADWDKMIEKYPEQRMTYLSYKDYLAPCSLDQIPHNIFQKEDNIMAIDCYESEYPKSIKDTQSLNLYLNQKYNQLN